jgi:hypothetical protein
MPSYIFDFNMQISYSENIVKSEVLKVRLSAKMIGGPSGGGRVFHLNP